MIWLDAHLSPRLAEWVRENLGHETIPLKELGLRDADDNVIFEHAREANVILITKDRDFSEIVVRRGPPPKVIWLRCGNTSETRLKEIFTEHLSEALELLSSEGALVEIR